MALKHSQVHERRKQVTQFLVQGFAPGEIARILQQEPETIYNDIRVIRSGRNPELAIHGVGEIFAQVCLNQKARAQYLWREADICESSAGRLFALREMRLQDNAMLRYARQISNSIAATQDAAELSRDEADMVGSLSMRLLAGSYKKPGATEGEIHTLKSILNRIWNGSKFTDCPCPPARLSALSRAGADSQLPEGKEVEAPPPDAGETCEREASDENL